MHFDGPMLTLSMSAPAWRSLYDHPIAQDSGGRWGDAPEERSQTMAPDDEIDGEALFEEAEAEADAILAREAAEPQTGLGAELAPEGAKGPMTPGPRKPSAKKSH
jgi:hypothetical protein